MWHLPGFIIYTKKKNRIIQYSHSININNILYCIINILLNIIMVTKKIELTMIPTAAGSENAVYIEWMKFTACL